MQIDAKLLLLLLLSTHEIANTISNFQSNAPNQLYSMELIGQIVEKRASYWMAHFHIFSRNLFDFLALVLVFFFIIHRWIFHFSASENLNQHHFQNWCILICFFFFTWNTNIWFGMVIIQFKWNAMTKKNEFKIFFREKVCKKANFFPTKNEGKKSNPSASVSFQIVYICIVQ